MSAAEVIIDVILTATIESLGITWCARPPDAALDQPPRTTGTLADIGRVFLIVLLLPLLWLGEIQGQVCSGRGVQLQGLQLNIQQSIEVSARLGVPPRPFVVAFDVAPAIQALGVNPISFAILDDGLPAVGPAQSGGPATGIDVDAIGALGVFGRNAMFADRVVDAAFGVMIAPSAGTCAALAATCTEHLIGTTTATGFPDTVLGPPDGFLTDSLENCAICPFRGFTSIGSGGRLSLTFPEPIANSDLFGRYDLFLFDMGGANDNAFFFVDVEPIPVCGNDCTDPGEQCGEPGLPICAPGSECSDCRCVASLSTPVPSLTPTPTPTPTHTTTRTGGVIVSTATSSPTATTSVATATPQRISTHTPRPQACTTRTFLPGTIGAPRILLVVDRSGSMGASAPGFPSSKWAAARTALSTVVQNLDEEAEFGLMVYPAGDQCEQGVLLAEVAQRSAGTIVSLLNDISPGGFTPTAATLGMAHNHVATLTGDSPRAVILATDGAPNCNGSLDPGDCQCVGSPCSDPRACLDDDASVDAVRALNASRIPTFVVGIPGVENFTGVLNGLAEAGGTAQGMGVQYYQANDADSLSSAIESITERVGSCRFDLPISVVSADTTSVRINDLVVARDVTRNDGWDVVDDDTVELFGATCDSVIEMQATVAIDFCSFTEPAGCPGDCNGDGKVTINELITAVRIALGLATLSACPAADVNANQQAEINELIAAVNAALYGCPHTGGTPTVGTPGTPTRTPLLGSTGTATPFQPPATLAPTTNATQIRTPTPSATITRTRTATRTPTGTATATRTRTPSPLADTTRTPTALPTGTATPSSTPTSPPSQAPVCRLGEESSLILSTGLLKLPLAPSGQIEFDPSETDGEDLALGCSVRSFQPVEIIGIGEVCVAAADFECPEGRVDCDGNDGNDITVRADHNIGACTGNPNCAELCNARCDSLGDGFFRQASTCEGFCTGGSNDGSACTLDSQCPGGSCGGPDGLADGNICECVCVEPGTGEGTVGGLSCALGLALTVELDGSGICGDVPPSITLPPLCGELTTGTSVASLDNLANMPGLTLELGPITGVARSCEDLLASPPSLSGTTLVGHLAFFGSAIGDILIENTFVCE